MMHNRKQLWSLLIPILFFCLYLHYSNVSGRTPTGDEPHYVLTTISLIKDQDINLLNNYTNKDYLDFGQYGELQMHAIEYDKGIFFSTHSYWFSLILAPFYLANSIQGIYFVYS